jgi:hypothetical protein
MVLKIGLFSKVGLEIGLVYIFILFKTHGNRLAKTPWIVKRNVFSSYYTI